MEDFDVGDNVAVKVAPIERGKCDVSRVTAVVVSLRKAARLHSVLKKNISKCNCKTGCKTSHFHCQKISTKCLPQCHKGIKCKNYDKEGPYDKKSMCLPKWGGG